MIQDLRSDSQRWQAEKDRGRGGGTAHIGDKKVTRHPDASVVAYQDSSIHASRQYHGPTAPEAYAAVPSSKTYSSPSYGGASESPHYTTTPTATYSHAYQPPSHTAHPAQPRTEPAYYGQHASYGSTPAPAPYSTYTQPPVQDPYGRTPAPQYTHSTPRYFGYYEPPFMDYH